MTLLNHLIKKAYAFLAYLLAPLALLLRTIGVRVLDINFRGIGHVALEPDVYVREQKLLKKKRFTILFAPYCSLIQKKPFSLSVSNPFLLDCWREHFLVIKNPILYLLLYPLFNSPLLRHNPDYYMLQKLAANYKEGFHCISIYNAFEKAYGRGKEFTPLIQLKEKDVKKGKNLLRELGVPEGSWYVCFNCREPGYYDAYNLRERSCRNAQIAHLELGLKAVIERGGWCIRTGSPGTAPLPPSLKRHERILDYPHTRWVSDFMDVFLLASCRFFLGNNSGITTVAATFGVPCVQTNVVPFGLLSVFPQDIAIFKGQHSKITGRPIPFAQSLKSLLSVSIVDREYEEFQVELIENTPEEIRDVVVEMLDRLEGRLIYTAEEEDLQKRFQAMLNSFHLSRGAVSRVGKEFLKKYSSEIS
jgi:putative glycosyltransferase (TIGR04372 family)